MKLPSSLIGAGVEPEDDVGKKPKPYLKASALPKKLLCVWALTVGLSSSLMVPAAPASQPWEVSR